MSSLKTTQLVVALSLLCLVFLGFSKSVEAAARPITDVAGAVANDTPRCILTRGPCADDDDCDQRCSLGGLCLRSRAASSNREDKIDVNRYKVPPELEGCCCWEP
ncbi:hypothetical protein C5167_025127 [Papaver somniferum]|uniref:Uncharacterized protein n=1 Tax=Papaver somniferum TaxID=3469 RepID=A0A4Y7JQJ6_PAPSO|nr:uncharacterized protein LOC113278324 [Papaver somniferum]RZC63373.1 hypothetical protein C5167_025127 [Papaver somniferum]